MSGEGLRRVVELNREIIFFAYGLVFFVLGLAIALQSRQASRLELARGLTWLAGFGFTHGLHEWGDLFIPIQAAYLSLQTVAALRSVQLMLLAISFACLLAFGVSLLRPMGWPDWTWVMPVGLLLAWAGLAALARPDSPSAALSWHARSDALARYLVGFPGGLMAAYALRRHALGRIAPLNVPQIVRMLRVSGLAMAFYALVGGLIPPPVSFFPGNWLNTASFEAVLGIPPAVPRSLVGLVLTVSTIRAMEVFNLETARRIEEMEQAQIISSERMRLARQLHDGSLQKVYTAGLLVESARKQAAAEGVVAERLARAESALGDAIMDLRHDLEELARPATQAPLEAALRRLAEDPSLAALVDIRLALHLPQDEALAPARADHVLAIVREALANAARHSRGSQVDVSARHGDNRLLVEVIDNGVGLATQVTPGYGLRNMRDRARLLGGELQVSSEPGKGTRVRLDVPWQEGA